jgi:hypothetical protein
MGRASRRGSTKPGRSGSSYISPLFRDEYCVSVLNLFPGKAVLKGDKNMVITYTEYSSDAAMVSGMCTMDLNAFTYTEDILWVQSDTIDRDVVGGIAVGKSDHYHFE